MISLNTKAEIIKERHPCFSESAHFKFGRIHLPVAPKCNIQCRFCLRSMNNYEQRPGVTEKILTPEEAIKVLERKMDRNTPLNVVAVAGPGEPLDNPETFEVFKAAGKKYPHLIRCLSTNGLDLFEKTDDLEKLGICTVSVAVNAVDTEVGADIYEYVELFGKRYTGKKAAEILINRQQAGVRKLVSRGMIVKINTVLIPEINKNQPAKIARIYNQLGADIMNIMPLIPTGKFAHMRPPTSEEISECRDICSVYMDQFNVCRQCRADACGIPADDSEGIFDDCKRKKIST